MVLRALTFHGDLVPVYAPSSSAKEWTKQTASSYLPRVGSRDRNKLAGVSDVGRLQAREVYFERASSSNPTLTEPSPRSRQHRPKRWSQDGPAAPPTPTSPKKRGADPRTGKKSSRSRGMLAPAAPPLHAGSGMMRITSDRIIST